MLGNRLKKLLCVHVAYVEHIRRALDEVKIRLIVPLPHNMRQLVRRQHTADPFRGGLFKIDLPVN